MRRIKQRIRRWVIRRLVLGRPDYVYVVHCFSTELVKDCPEVCREFLKRDADKRF